MAKMFTKLYGVASVIVMVAAVSGPVMAQAQIENATRTADPARAAQQFTETQKLPELTGSPEIKGASLQEAPEGAEKVRFVLKQLVIDGVSTYKADEIAPLYEDKLGQEVSLADIYDIAAALTRKYRNEGYILAQVVVPPQTIEEGIVHIRTVEGFINTVNIEGELKPGEKPLLDSYAAHLKGDGVFNAATMERYLLLINEIPGIKARTVLSPSPTVVGASDVTIFVERNKYDASVGVDNFGSRYLGPYEGYVSAALNSILGMNESISGYAVMAGDKDRADELLFGSLSYEQAVNQYGTKIRALTSATSTEPGYDIDQFDVTGRSNFYSIAALHPFIRSRTVNWLGRAIFDWRDVVSKSELDVTREDRIRSLRLGTTYQFMDTTLGVGVNAVDVEFSKGLPVMGASDYASVHTTREDGDPQYSKLTFGIQRLQSIVSKLNLLIAGQGQWSAAPLLSSEEFGVGGTDFGRGYDSSEIVGDDGIAGKLELQFNQPKEIPYITNYQLYTFLDIGKVWNQDATTSGEKQDSLTSTGLGVRAEIMESTKAGFAVALPLTRDVDTTSDNSPRFYFNLSRDF